MTKTEHTSDAEVIVPSDSVTVDIQPFIMPFAILLSAIILSVSMFISANRIATGGGITGGNNNVANQPSNPTDTAPSAEPTTAKVSLDDDAVKGDKNKAKIAIVEFSDYECPFCQKFRSDTYDQIIKEYVDTGKAVFVYRDLPLPFHPQAQIQAEGAECAGEQGSDKYFAMHNKIFEKGGKLTADQLKEAAKEIGINTASFNDCLDNGKMKEEVNKDSQDAAAAGINGTPGFVVGKLNSDGTVEGDIISGALPFTSFKATISNYFKLF